MTLYTDIPAHDADAHYDRITRHEDAMDARAAYILATPNELEYVVENQQPEIWPLLVELIDAVNHAELRAPYWEARLLQVSKGLRNMLTSCAEKEVETYEMEEE